MKRLQSDHLRIALGALTFAIALPLLVVALGCATTPPLSTVAVEQSVPTDAQALPHLMIEGRNTYFLADLEKLQNGSKRTIGGTPPLSAAEAERLAKNWLRRNAPNAKGTPKVSELSKVAGGSEFAYYHVDLGVADAPLPFQDVLVLMDGTVVESELK